MHTRCPHCHESVEIAEETSLREINCSTCGSSFSLVDDETITCRPHEVRKLGHFELFQLLGTGAYGSVWKARDTQLDRTVAIKIPRKEQLTAAEIEQFLREARAAAQLKHANIVAVHEVGREGDTVYIASDFVEGLTLSDWLTGQRPSYGEAAALCVKIADALHAAHEAGVVHRDLKPSNIMIDADGQPHVTDFGLAKRDAGELTVTVDGQVLGTPAYMSPEQARGDSHTADRRSDVYALGVLLFELLTGERPFRGNSRMLLHQVLHVEPPAPRSLNANVPKDLQTICLRCLEKQPARRFATATELSAELQRFLNGRPILSRPISKVERAWRWCLRNPAAAAATTAVVVIFLIAFVVVSISLNRSLQLAERNRQLASSEHAARLQADQRFRLAQELVDNYMTGVSEDPRLQAVGAELVRLDILRRVCEFYDRFAAELPDDQDIQAERAKAYGRLAQLCTALGRPQEAAQNYQRALDFLLPLCPAKDGKAGHHEALAATYMNFGALHRTQGQTKDAEQQLQKAAEIFQRLHKRFPKNDYRGSLGGVHLNLGNLLSDDLRYDEAEREYRLALQIFQEIAADDPQPDVLDALADNKTNLGVLYRQTGRLDLADQSYRDALATRRQLVELAPDNPKYRNAVARSLHNLAILLLLSERFEEAETALVEAMRIRRDLVAQHPELGGFQDDLKMVERNLARLYAQTGRREDAVTMYRQAIDDYRRLVEKFPEVTEFQTNLALHYRDLARHDADAGRLDAGQASLQAAIDLFRGLALRHPDASLYRDALADTHVLLGNHWTRQHDLAAATIEYEEAQRLYRQLKQANQFSLHDINLAIVLRLLGETLQAQGEVKEAMTHFQESLELLISVPADDPHYDKAQQELPELRRQLDASPAEQPPRDNEPEKAPK